MKNCYCSSDKTFKNCCESFLKQQITPTTPEQVMRSRYSAYVLHDADYLVATTHISERKYYSKADILEWSKTNTWLKLEVVEAYDNIVEFKAYYLDEKQLAQVHHERSTFKQEGNVWYYVDGVFFA
ncbi:YchJ family metal-binding protein [uncultured Flavobacterium sp.]|uniref:YchJ family protein n=1 Tax=uncultured Flavobacterium sp. TaxID=165435 RepID=UPI0030EEAB22|tara:strand:+ start:46740 stop:47117 length:378 start_codon:yes stop_codon:yes gene_type:complete